MKIAWRNLYRQGRRTIITATAMAIGAGLTLAGIGLSDGMYVEMFDSLVTHQIGHVQVHNLEYPAQKSIYETMDEAAAIKAVDSLDSASGKAGAAPRVYGFALLSSKRKATGARLMGVDPSREINVTEVQNKLRSGDYLDHEAAGQILLGDGLADTLGVKVGDELVAVTQAADGSLGNNLYKVRGLFHTSNTMLDRGGAILHIRDLQQLLSLEGKIHEISLRAKLRSQIPVLVAATQEAFKSMGVLVRSWKDVNPILAQMMAMQDIGVWLLLVLVFSVAGLGILNTMLMAVFERTRELGVMRALGLTPLRVISLILMETGLLGLLSAAIGAVLGGLLTWYLAVVGLDLSSFTSGVDAMGMTFEPVMHAELRVDRLVLVVVFVEIVSLVSAIWPAIRAARLDPVAAMREE